jgi:carbon-monoxide dehydrogenase large subunit
MPIGSILGRAVRRSEDPRFLTGAAQYSEDIPTEGTLHAAFVRAFVAHARIEGIDTSQARAMPGVAGVFTASDLALPPLPAAEAVGKAFARPLLAEGSVRFVGEPVAVVLAESREQAMDGAEMVVVDYDPLPAVADATDAADSEATLLFPGAGTNVARDSEFVTEGDGGDPLAGAEVVVEGRFVNQRVAPVPMEVNGAVAVPDPDGGGGLTMYVPSQAPFWVRDEVARALGLDLEALRVIAPAVGGGFGAKGEMYTEQILMAALALRVGRPVRYVETRSESMTAMVHGRAQVQEVELGAKRDGTMVGLRARVVADMGAYPVGSFLPQLTRRMASGVYRIPHVSFHSLAVVTNTTPVGAYRGAGRPEAAAMVERAVDMLAAELGMDPAEVRRRNFIGGEWPFTTAAGATYDSGDYERTLDHALRLAEYDSLRREQAERRARGDVLQLGVGLACYVEITGWGSEFGSVEVHDDGRVTVLTGLSPHGQGHETSLAQLVSGTLGVPFESVDVVHSDTRRVPRGEGTSGSRSLQVGGSAVLRAGQQVVEKARRIAAHLLEAALEDVVLQDPETGDGQARVGLAGVPDRSFTWAELAGAAAEGDSLPEGVEPGLVAESDFDTEGNSTFPFGCHVAVVEVDVETGRTRLIRHVAVDDCGRILNPLLVEGQVHGGVAQGAAQALFEEVLYDQDANPLTANLASYEMPSAADLPDLESHHTETPTPFNPLGAKGIGEAGTIGSTPAVQNAVIDAVSHLGIRHIDMPLSPERVWRAIRDATA